MTLPESRVVTAEVSGDTFVLDHATGRYFRLDGTGADMWRLLRNGATVEEVAAAVSNRTGAPYERVRRDAARFSAELREAGLID